MRKTLELKTICQESREKIKKVSVVGEKRFLIKKKRVQDIS